jgi:AbrB family looped-hinge helix DNA binding protein
MLILIVRSTLHARSGLVPLPKTTLTSKGQITLPVSVRKELNLKPQDRLIVSTEGGRVILEREGLTLDDVIGSLPPLPLGASDDLDEEIEAAIDETLFGENGKYRTRSR